MPGAGSLQHGSCAAIRAAADKSRAGISRPGDLDNVKVAPGGARQASGSSGPAGSGSAFSRCPSAPRFGRDGGATTSQIRRQEQMGTERDSLTALGAAGKQRVSLPPVLLLPPILLTFPHRSTKRFYRWRGTSVGAASWRCRQLAGGGLLLIKLRETARQLGSLKGVFLLFKVRVP